MNKTNLTGYSLVANGHSCERILTMEECKSAGLQLGLPNSTFQISNNQQFPPYCYYNPGYKRMAFNNALNSSAPCGQGSIYQKVCVCHGNYLSGVCLGYCWLGVCLQGARYLWCQRFSACFVLKNALQRGEGQKREGVKISKQSALNLWHHKFLPPSIWLLVGLVRLVDPIVLRVWEDKC